MSTAIQADVITVLKKKAGKEFVDMSDNKFKELIEDQPIEDLAKVRQFLVDSRDFYKKVLLEQYREKHPNSFRYREAEELIQKYNKKGQILKIVIDSKK